MRMGRPINAAASGAPYRLRAILLDHGISHGVMRAAIQFQEGSRAGSAIAPSTFSALLNNRVWPRTIAEVAIRESVDRVLAEQGVDADIVATAWDIDGVVDAKTEPRKTKLAQPATPTEPPFQLPESEMLSADAREHFTLVRHPFQDDVQGSKDIYLSKDQRYIRQAMHAAAKHGGFLAIVGESGSGKTTLRRDLLEQIRTSGESIVALQPANIDKTVLTAAHISDAIINDLSTEKPKLSLEAKSRQVQRMLASSARTGNSHVLIIEEAHDLSVATLKYLKRFWELEDGFKKLLGIILIGQPELGERLDERKNFDAREVIRRIEVARLKSLNGNLEEYLALKFNRVGKQLDDIFATDAFDAIRNRLTQRRPNSTIAESHLYPLVVNNLCVKAMNVAAELGLPKVTADLVGRL